MIIQETLMPGKILIDCMTCGGMFLVDDYRNEIIADTVQQCFERYRKCDSCRTAEKQAMQQQKIMEHRAQLEAQLPQLMEAAGLPRNYTHDRETDQIFTQPPCRYAAEWIYRSRFRNLLISGETAAGKSTSACFVAALMIKEEKKVGYTNLRQLLSHWKSAKTSDRDAVTERMLRDIFHLDLFIIDEVVGKAKVSESGQELLFEILEAVNNGECKAKIWLLGNFYKGSIEEIFSDPDPVRRRLEENFTCVLLNRPQQTVTPITVWKGSENE